MMIIIAFGFLSLMLGAFAIIFLNEAPCEYSGNGYQIIDRLRRIYPDQDRSDIGRFCQHYFGSRWNLLKCIMPV